MVLLGGKSGRTVALLDRLAGGALLLATPVLGLGLASSLFDTRGELARLSGELVGGIGEKVRGLSRFDRTERVCAAHAVIVVAAYFEAMSGHLLGGQEPAAGDRWRLTAVEQLKLAGAKGAESARSAAVATELLRTPVPLPSPQRPFEDVLADLLGYYRSQSVAVADFLAGLAPWDELNDTGRAELRDGLTEEVPRLALARYQAWFLDLERECPEVGLWADRIDHQATRNLVRKLGTGLAELEQTIAAFAFGRPASGVAAVLERAWLADLERPILSSGDVPGGLVIPTLEQGYVRPRFRVSEVDSASDLISEQWWGRRAERDDLAEFLAGYLTGPQATRAPLLVLGQPGSGKSVFTRVLSAKLPATEYLVVRVVLRDVPAEADLQTQIELAVRQATGEAVSWPELARSAGDALCVVLLDGFDELLQATGISQSDYLEKVSRFQQREAELGRPVAVAVTSRIAVADRARCTPGTVAIRLEPFAEPQVRQWLQVWSALNGPALAARGLRPPPVEAVLAYPELASQPLLLVMLALYDFDANALQQEQGRLRPTELYERLLVGFARREIAKSGAGLSGPQIDQEVERELLRLALVAFAMFSRGRQWVTEDELDADLGVLLPEAAVAAGPRLPLRPGEQAVGRFFFVHESRAGRDDRQLRTFEFLHATFAEYLIGRLIAAEAAELARTAARDAGRSRPGRIDDAFLHALLSHAPLAQRGAAISFLKELLDGLPEETRTWLRAVAITLFQGSLDARGDRTYAGYAPVRLNVPARHAMWSANLVLLATFVAEVTAGELFPDHPDLLYAWRDLALLWRAQLGHNSWNGILATVQVARIWQDGRRDLRIAFAGEDPVLEPVDPYWIYGMPPGARSGLVWQHHDVAGLRLHAGFVADRRVDVLAHAAEPLLQIDRLVTTFGEVGAGRAASAAHVLTRLWVASNRPDGDVQELVAAYRDCLEFLFLGAPFNAFVARQFSLDEPRLPRTFLPEVRRRLDGAESIHDFLADSGA